MDVEWFYPGMLPMVRWDGEGQTTVVDSIAAPAAIAVNLADFAGQMPSLNKVVSSSLWMALLLVMVVVLVLLSD